MLPVSVVSPDQLCFAYGIICLLDYLTPLFNHLNISHYKQSPDYWPAEYNYAENVKGTFGRYV